MQSFEEYRKDFLEDTRATEESESNGTVASFVKVCALKLFEGDVLPDYSPCFFQGSGYRNASVRVDGYAFDENDGQLYMLAALYSGSDECGVLLGSDAKTALDRCRAFASNAVEHDLAGKIEISTEAYDLARLIVDRLQYISKFVVILLTDLSLSEKAIVSDTPSDGRKKAQKKRANVLSAESIAGIDVEYRIWDMSRFYRIFASGDGHEEIEIDFTQYSDEGIPCLEAAKDKDGNCISYLCTMPANVIADLYDEYGSRILEGNVRSFLGRKGSKRSVNNQIRNTILNDPSKFFVYNNGLATTAVDVVVDHGKLVYAKDLQIVNGGQTTASLAAARRIDGADLSEISVLMKLTKVSPTSAPEIVPIISKSANSQNKINPADFFSTHEYHVRMEQISRRKFAPAKDGAQHETHWFYERARGQYIQATMSMTKAQEKKFITQNPKDQVVTKTDLAKVLSAWDGYPHLVSKGAESNFEKFAERTEEAWENRKDDFNENYFQEAMALVLLYRSVDKMIPKQDWYEGGYKANIVAYSISLLHHLIGKWYPGKDLDLQKIWQKQKCPYVLMQQMAIIAQTVYRAITSDNRLVENVTQWCKQEKCWERIKNIYIKPLPGFDSVLTGYEERKELQRNARVVQRIDNTIDTQKAVLELGEDYWKRLEIWLKRHPMATDAENKALRIATKIMQGYFPDDRQCKSLMSLRDKAIQDGFPKK